MAEQSGNETWIIDAGDAVIEKKAAEGFESLSPLEHLIYCLWVADYGMRNAGDLTTAADVYPRFQNETVRIASKFNLPFTLESFSLPAPLLQQQYFDRFDRICHEVQNA